MTRIHCPKCGQRFYPEPEGVLDDGDVCEATCPECKSTVQYGLRVWLVPTNHAGDEEPHFPHTQ